MKEPMEAYTKMFREVAVDRIHDLPHRCHVQVRLLPRLTSIRGIKMGTLFCANANHSLGHSVHNPAPLSRA